MHTDCISNSAILSNDYVCQVLCVRAYKWKWCKWSHSFEWLVSSASWNFKVMKSRCGCALVHISCGSQGPLHTGIQWLPIYLPSVHWLQHKTLVVVAATYCLRALRVCTAPKTNQQSHCLGLCLIALTGCSMPTAYGHQVQDCGLQSVSTKLWVDLVVSSS